MLNISYATPSTFLLLTGYIIPSPLSGLDSWIFMPTTSSDLDSHYQQQLTDVISSETMSLNTILANIESDKLSASVELNKAKPGSKVYNALTSQLYELNLQEVKTTKQLAEVDSNAFNTVTGMYYNNAIQRITRKFYFM